MVDYFRAAEIGVEGKKLRPEGFRSSARCAIQRGILSGSTPVRGP
jgi:hypothetical protein